MIRSLFLAAAAVSVISAPAAAAETPREVHEAIITLDTHLDTPASFGIPGWDMMQRHDVGDDGSQVDYPRMVEGGLDGGFFAVFTPAQPLTPQGDQAARDAALVRLTEIREMVAKHGDTFALARTADDATAIAKSGKRIVYISMENSQPVEADLSLMKTFYTLGVRMMGPAHFKTNDLADSATDAARWNGLSPKGREFVAEANRLGIILDASHSSDATLDQMLALSTTPVVLSHSGLRAIYNHPRNIDDARLKALAAKGGVIQVLAFDSYMIDAPKNPAREAALAGLMKDAGQTRISVEARRAFFARRRAIDAQYPAPKASFETFIAHLYHAIEVAGIDHVGVGLDLDGGGGVTGLEDITAAGKITARMLADGYTKADVEKVWSGNILRVMRAVEEAKGR